MPTTAPETVVVNTIVAAGITIDGAAAALGTNVFDGAEVSADSGAGIPDAAFFCVTYGGPTPKPYLGINKDYRQFMVQVVYRGLSNNFESGVATARLAYEALHAVALSNSLKTEGYIFVFAKESDPVYLGLNDLEQPRWSFNLRLGYKG